MEEYFNCSGRRTWWRSTLIVLDGGLGGGVYGGRGSAQDSCRTDAGMRKCDELSSCRSVNFTDSRPNCSV